MNIDVRGDALLFHTDARQRGRSLKAVLEEDLFLPERYIDKACKSGWVRIGKEAADADQILAAGQAVWLTGGVVSDADSAAYTIAEPACVLYEDDHLLVADKPAGQLVHRDGAGTAPTLDDAVASYRLLQGQPQAAWHIHRLDRDTTGLVLYAKHAWIARALDARLAQHQIVRRYLAITAGTMPQADGTLTGPIGRDRHVSGRYRVAANGKPAITHYHVRAAGVLDRRAVSLLECWLETGRTHQIRVHLANAGCPIIGDVLYGGGTGAGSIRMADGFALHACHLAFIHPYTGESIQVDAPLPAAWTPFAAAFPDGLLSI